MKATIWIAYENEAFWNALENKSGWVNMVMRTIQEEKKREEELYGPPPPYDPLASIHDPFKHLPPEERPIY